MADVENPGHRLVEMVASSGPAPDTDEEQGETLDARELRFVDLVASGSTLGDAATEIGIGYRTARRWKKRAEIATAIRDRASEQVALGRAVLAAGMGRAARSLVDMSDGKTKAEPGKVAAAKAVVESTTKLVEVERVQEEINELKAWRATMPSQPSTFRRS
jgi:hypothetical protein